MMKIIKTSIPDLLIVEPDVFKDQRGYFFESYNQERYFENDMKMIFVQDNESKSMKNVLRGLHFQKPPYAQGKLVRVIQGKVVDVAVDI
ncbi:MAG TPA: dTDP-4-dehydrorhamnose 3,5-epimerase, partial [Bacteroidales bacterium]|nr:dTDP-4-dehydrorhamnose 3,5-epimerase [Bacteroidales bacterium]